MVHYDIFADLWQIASDIDSKSNMVLARLPCVLPKRTAASIQEYNRRFDVVSRYEEYPTIVDYLTALSIKAESSGLQPWE